MLLVKVLSGEQYTLAIKVVLYALAYVRAGAVQKADTDELRQLTVRLLLAEGQASTQITLISLEYVLSPGIKASELLCSYMES